MEENILTHYGVLGMKWGVRKKQPSSTKEKIKKTVKSTKKSTKKYLNKRKNYTQKINARRKSKYTDLANLSNSELQNRITRMQLERKYASLLRDQKYAVTTGMNFSEDIIYKNGKQTVNQLVKKGMRTAVKLA